jgi:hypothetical protein
MHNSRERYCIMPPMYYFLYPRLERTVGRLPVGLDVVAVIPNNDIE